MSSVKILFLILTLGYILGSISFLKIKLGTSGVLLVALVFGHYGFEMSGIVRDIGLVSFVAAVGIIAGPVFFTNFRAKAVAYITIGTLITITGAAICVGAVKLLCIPVPLAVGLMNGALTSTPGLAAAIEATGDPSASIGYGIAYPFGVLGVVLFIQILPKLLRYNFDDGKGYAENLSSGTGIDSSGQYISLDGFDFFPFALTVTVGLLAARVIIPLPGGGYFSLGASGGPLLAGLVIGRMGHIGRISLEVKKATLDTMRELGLALFLAGAGASAGKGFVSTITEHGAILFLVGIVMTVVPMFVGYFAAVRLFRLEMLSTLGSICGGMTSTPALGVLISATGSDGVSFPYAATYPVALILVVLASQFISIFL